ncbi:MAG: hypothetical protein KGH98_00240 [Candidatus Micrarchaeota archaeon]|nr:hypothetical protein [Candidatus Micrarchaeota archaeon]
MSFGDRKGTDIWFTMGPASSDRDVIRQILEAGATGVRLTFSYGTPQIQIERANLVRDVAMELSVRCTIVADIEGEKIRLGEMDGSKSISVTEGETLNLVPSSNFHHEQHTIPVNSDSFITKAKKGDRIVIGDGATSLKIVEKHRGEAVCDVVKGGVINPNRGIIDQSSGFQPACLTDKDRSDLGEIAESGAFDAVAVSSVSNSDDIVEVRRIINERSPDLRIIAKIETKSGILNLGKILEASDMIMIARGDLALFLPWYELGNNVDRIVHQAKRSGKPWIMATQVAEGLERFSFPTRAEICDITHWVKEGAGGFLLSTETAFGKRPVDAVACVSKVVSAASVEEVQEKFAKHR